MMKNKPFYITLIIAVFVIIALVLSYRYYPEEIHLDYKAVMYDEQANSYEEVQVKLEGKVYKSLLREDYFSIRLQIGDEIFPKKNYQKLIPYLDSKKPNTIDSFQPTQNIENHIVYQKDYSILGLRIFDFVEGSHTMGTITFSKDKEYILITGFQNGEDHRKYIFPYTEKYKYDFERYEKDMFEGLK